VTTTRPSSSITGTSPCRCRRSNRHLLPLLDGNHDRDALLDAMVDLVLQNMIRIDRDDEELVDVAEVRDVLAGEIDAMPRRLVELKLVRVSARANTVGGRNWPASLLIR